MLLSFVWVLLYSLWIATEVLVLLITRTRRSTGEVRDRGSLQVLWVVIFASLTAGIWVGEATPHTLFGVAPWVLPASVGFIACGLAVRWTAIATLGKAFSANVAIRATQTVNTNGLFHFVRHPSYSGMLLIFLAVGMHTRSWLGLAIILVPTMIALLYRIHVEESALGAAFGQQYADYSRKTKRLIPGVY
jgi:protein-S-isoprenylcysteine O-methyltransferase Ste14